MTRSYGWRPDLPDHRDSVRKICRISTPDYIDLRPQDSPIYDQRALGSCTANAICGAMEFDLRKEGHDVMLSRLFVYYNERAMEGTIEYDAGANIRDGIKSVVDLGAPAENEWPYSDKNPGPFTAKPLAQVYKDALTYRVDTYERVPRTLAQLKSVLASGYPFIFGFTAYESFESDEVAETGILNMPKRNEEIVGGHAVICLGATEKDKRFIIRNSFGSEWGIKGYFTMPYDYLLNPNLSDDFWAIRTVKF